ncbi:MAG: hypothetical protein ACT4QC_06835, partial [Planctomycetaceae bacterium]
MQNSFLRPLAQRLTSSLFVLALAGCAGALTTTNSSLLRPRPPLPGELQARLATTGPPARQRALATNIALASSFGDDAGSTGDASI